MMNSSRMKPVPPVKPPRRSIDGSEFMEVFQDIGSGGGSGTGGRSRSFHPSHQHSLKNSNQNLSKSQHQLNTWYYRTIDWVEDSPYTLPAPPEEYRNDSRNQHHFNNREPFMDISPPHPRMRMNQSTQSQVTEPMYAQVQKNRDRVVGENPYESVPVVSSQQQRTSRIYEEVVPPSISQHQRPSYPPPSIPVHQSQIRSNRMNTSGTVEYTTPHSYNVTRSNSSFMIPTASQQQTLNPGQVLEQLQQLQAREHNIVEQQVSKVPQSNHSRRPMKQSESSHIRSKSEHQTRCPTFPHTHEITGEITIPTQSSFDQSASSSFGSHGNSNNLHQRRLSVNEGVTSWLYSNFESSDPTPTVTTIENTVKDTIKQTNVVYARIPPPPPPDVALKAIRLVIKPLFQDYKKEKKMRPKNVETITEEKYFSSMDSKSGKRVLISTRKTGRIKQLYPDKSILTDPVPDDFWADKENTGPRPTRTVIEDGKKSLRRNKNSHSFGTAERKKRSKLSTLPRDHKMRDIHSSSKGSSEEKVVVDTVIVVGNIDFEPNSKSMTESGINDSKSPSGRSPMGRSPIERSLSCDLRPPNISPFDGQKEWAAIESIMSGFVTQTSLTTTTTTASSDQNSNSDQVESEVESKLKVAIDNLAIHHTGKVSSNENPPRKKPEVPMKPEVPKKPMLPPKPSRMVTGHIMSMSLDDPRQSSGSRNSKSPRSLDGYLPVHEWAKLIGVSKSIAQSLVDHGFDELRFMGPNVLEVSDLKELGITRTEDQRLILENCKNLPIVSKLSTSSNVTIKQWLESLNLVQYETKFLDNGFVDMEKVKKIWEVELNCVLDINKLGHRKRILASLGETISLITDLGLEDLDLDRMSIGLLSSKV